MLKRINVEEEEETGSDWLNTFWTGKSFSCSSVYWDSKGKLTFIILKISYVGV
jgi:hypothetical protein